MQSHMIHNFSQIPSTNIERSVFDRSCSHKTTFNSGYLVPIWVDEYLPGDTFKTKIRIFARLTTTVTPFIDNLKATVFFFAIPNRLVWNNWQKMCGEQENPGDSIDYLVPQVVMPDSNKVTVSGQQVEIGGTQPMSLFNYLGVPMFVPNLSVSALWSRAYNLTWNEWFRDENLQNSAVVDKDDGPDTYSDYYLRRRGKRHDYFTSALPWPQKDFGINVTIPLGTTAPVFTSDTRRTSYPSEYGLTWSDSAGNSVTPNAVMDLGISATNGQTVYGSNTLGTLASPAIVHPDNLVTDLRNASAASINALREAFQVQRWLETCSRSGSRYTEIIRSHFHCISPDARLQRPEYLGGNTQYVDILPVTQTSSTDSSSPQGNLSANGILSMTAGFTKSFTEHGVLLCLLHVGADLTYQQGLPRMFSRRTRFDFYWPTLAHLGEQSILCREIRALGSVSGSEVSETVGGVTYTDSSVFGYQERYAEYRYKESLITGLLNSNSRDSSGNPNSLDVWHLAQNFANMPTLSSQWIEDNPPMSRVKAITTEPDFILDTFCDCKCARPMPVYSVPGLIDHF